MPYTGEREGLKCEICRVGADFGPELEGRKDGFVDLAVSATEKSRTTLRVGCRIAGCRCGRSGIDCRLPIRCWRSGWIRCRGA